MANALPQTLPGVPSPSIDPTVADLAKMSNADHIWAWLGATGPLATSFMEALSGDGAQMQLRDVVSISFEDYTEAVAGTSIPKPQPQAAAAAAVGTEGSGTANAGQQPEQPQQVFR